MKQYRKLHHDLMLTRGMLIVIISTNDSKLPQPINGRGHDLRNCIFFKIESTVAGDFVLEIAGEFDFHSAFAGAGCLFLVLYVVLNCDFY